MFQRLSKRPVPDYYTQLCEAINFWNICFTIFPPLKHFDVPVCKFVAAVRLIDDLSNPDDIALVIANWHRQNQRCFVSGSHVNGAVESRILMSVKYLF